MRYLILILSVLFIFACAAVKDRVVVDINTVNMSEMIYQEGYLNIAEVISTWKPGPLMSSIGGMPMYGFINPDEQQDIQYVIVITYRNMPVGYTYLLHGEPYAYFMSKKGNFEPLLNIDKEQWKLNFEDMFLLESL